jgi:hypothetical protein
VRLDARPALSGRVDWVIRDARGEAPPGALVEWRAGVGPWRRVESQKDLPGTYPFELRAGWPDPSAFARLRGIARPGAAVEVNDPSDTVVLRVPGRTVRVLLQGVPLGLIETHAEIRFGIGRHDVASARGWPWDVQVPGVPEGVGLRVSVALPGTAYLAHEVSVQPVGDEVRVSLAPAGSLRGRLVLPEGARNPSVVAHVLRSYPYGLPGAVRADGTFEIRGVPPGRWTVAASAASDDAPLDGTASLGPEDEGEIHLFPVPR